MGLNKQHSVGKVHTSDDTEERNQPGVPASQTGNSKDLLEENLEEPECKQAHLHLGCQDASTAFILRSCEHHKGLICT